MAKPVDVIAADLDDLAAELENEAAEYRRTAASLRKRTPPANNSTSSPPLNGHTGSVPSTAPGESQQLLLKAYEAAPADGDYSIDELMRAVEEITGVQMTKTAAYATNNRLRKNGRIERSAHGRYRLARAEPVVAVPSPTEIITSGWDGAERLRREFPHEEDGERGEEPPVSP